MLAEESNEFIARDLPNGAGLGVGKSGTGHARQQGGFGRIVADASSQPVSATPEVSLRYTKIPVGIDS